MFNVFFVPKEELRRAVEIIALTNPIETDFFTMSRYVEGRLWIVQQKYDEGKLFPVVVTDYKNRYVGVIFAEETDDPTVVKFTHQRLLPEFRDKGYDGAMFEFLKTEMKKKGYTKAVEEFLTGSTELAESAKHGWIRDESIPITAHGTYTYYMKL